MDKIEIKTKSEIETEKFGEVLAKSLVSPCIISLKGDLGAGKTCFVKGFAKGLNITDLVTSPTFTIMNEYNSGIAPLYHFDMYRLKSEEDLVELGLSEYLNKRTLDGFSVIEWAENIDFNAENIKIEITKISDNERLIILEAK